MPDVQADISTMRERLAVARVRGLAPDEVVAADAVETTLAEIENHIETTKRSPLVWWRGSLIEAVHERMHAARVMMVDVLDDVELAAEVPGVVARAQQVLHPDDPRRLPASAFAGLDRPSMQAALRGLMDESYDSADRHYQQLRRFRNIVILATFVAFVMVGIVVGYIHEHPSYFPLCFDAPPVADATTTADTAAQVLNCPTAAKATSPRPDDVVVLAFVGLMGGLLSAIVTIRTLKGRAAPYDAPVALAVLKLPFGALTALAGIALIHGGFVPGLSDLDTQDQILTYALLFGAAQHLITRLLDQKAQDLLDAVPGKGTTSDPGKPTTATTPEPPPATPPDDGTDDGMDDGETDTVVAEVLAEPEEPEPTYADNPYEGEDDLDQDDESPVMPAAPQQDHS